MNAIEKIPQTSSLASVAKSLLRASRQVGPDLLCRRGMAPTEEQSRELRQEAASLQSSLRRSPTDSAVVTVLLVRLLQAYPMRDGEEASMEARMEALLTATANRPAWIVDEACRRWLQASSGLAEANYSFPPVPSQLAAVCQLVAHEILNQAKELNQAASIQEEELPPDNERRAAFMADMEAKFGAHFGIGAKSDEDAATRKASLNAQMVRASDIMLAMEFAAHGLPVPPEGSLEASPALLRALDRDDEGIAA